MNNDYDFSDINHIIIETKEFGLEKHKHSINDLLNKIENKVDHYVKILLILRTVIREEEINGSHFIGPAMELMLKRKSEEVLNGTPEETKDE